MPYLKLKHRSNELSTVPETCRRLNCRQISKSSNSKYYPPQYIIDQPVFLHSFSSFLFGNATYISDDENTYFFHNNANPISFTILLFLGRYYERMNQQDLDNSLYYYFNIPVK